jgi:ubiquinone/menaquinone biosynthesis C-methylase UbiE
MIDPKELMQNLTVEQLCETADQYFRSLSDPTPWMVKPFSSLIEAPELLQNVGALLSGLHLAKTMTVLDFGAGSCWLSRMLSQLQCSVICCDASPTALEIGRKLYERMPVLGNVVFPPEFLAFDGHTIGLPDRSVDRIVCNDAFHHVANQHEVLSEFARVLKPGGVAGFSEAGPFHSRSAQSQQEMRNYNVLENDIRLNEVFAIAQTVGFDRISAKWLANLDGSLEEYNLLLAEHQPSGPSASLASAIKEKIVATVRRMLADRTMFFLYKGEFRPDSRSHFGLSHRLHAEPAAAEIAAGGRLNVALAIENNGSAKWLAENTYGIGVVKIGTHLYDSDDKLLDFDFTRHNFAGTIEPGEKARLDLAINIASRGTFRLAFDLVSEGVCWFELLGSAPAYINVTVK